MKLLVKKHIGYIKDYGLISDLMGETQCGGLSLEFVDLMFKQGHTFSYEFVENKEIPPYEINGLKIPKGDFNVYVELNSSQIA